jgi:CMP-N-acetylneuraminic acid synthetase
LRLASDIDAVVDTIAAGDIDSGFSVCSVDVHPAYMYRLNAAHEAQAFLPRADSYLRSQDLEPLYYVNGAVYVLRPSTFRARSTVMSDRPAAYIMPRERSIDIDDDWEFLFAEMLMKHRLASSERPEGGVLSIDSSFG